MKEVIMSEVKWKRRYHESDDEGKYGGEEVDDEEVVMLKM
jgi:hypothetical protein